MSTVDDLPTLDGDDRDVVGGRAPEREPDGVADPRRTRRRGHCEARRPRWQQPSDLLVRDDQQPRVHGSHEPAALPLLLARLGAASARAALALEPLDARAIRVHLALQRSDAAAPPRVAEPEAHRERQVQHDDDLPQRHGPGLLGQCTWSSGNGGGLFSALSRSTSACTAPAPAGQASFRHTARTYPWRSISTSACGPGVKSPYVATMAAVPSVTTGNRMGGAAPSSTSGWPVTRAGTATISTPRMDSSS